MAEQVLSLSDVQSTQVELNAMYHVNKPRPGLVVYKAPLQLPVCLARLSTAPDIASSDVKFFEPSKAGQFALKSSFWKPCTCHIHFEPNYQAAVCLQNKYLQRLFDTKQSSVEACCHAGVHLRGKQGC